VAGVETRSSRSGLWNLSRPGGSRACPGRSRFGRASRRFAGPRAPPSISGGRGPSDGRPSRLRAFARPSQGAPSPRRTQKAPWVRLPTPRRVDSPQRSCPASPPCRDDEGNGGDGLHRAREALLLNSADVQSQPPAQGSMLKHWPWLLNLGLTNCAQPPALHASLPRTRYVTLAVVMFPAASTAVAVKSFEPIVPVDSVAG